MKNFLIGAAAAFGLSSTRSGMIPDPNNLANTATADMAALGNMPAVSTPEEEYPPSRNLLQEINTTKNNSSEPDISKETLSAECLSVIENLGLNETDKNLVKKITHGMINNFLKEDIKTVYHSLNEDNGDEYIKKAAVKISNYLPEISIAKAKEIINLVRNNKGKDSAEIVNKCVTSEFKDFTDGAFLALKIIGGIAGAALFTFCVAFCGILAHDAGIDRGAVVPIPAGPALAVPADSSEHSNHRSSSSSVAVTPSNSPISSRGDRTEGSRGSIEMI